MKPEMMVQSKLHQRILMMILGTKMMAGQLKNGDNGDVNDAIGRTLTTTPPHLGKIFLQMNWKLRTSRSYLMKSLAGYCYDELT